MNALTRLLHPPAVFAGAAVTLALAVLLESLESTRPRGLRSRSLH